MTDGTFDNLTVNNSLIISGGILQFPILSCIYMQANSGGGSTQALGYTRYVDTYDNQALIVQGTKRSGIFQFEYYYYPGSGSVYDGLMALNQSGQLQLIKQGSSAGLLIGGDTNLYRSAPNVLKTDDQFAIGDTGNWTQISLCPDQADAMIEKTKKSNSNNWFWLDAFADSGYSASIGLFRGTVSGTPKFLILGGDNYATTPFEFLPRDGKITIFGDTTLYRSSQNHLATNSDMTINGALTATSASISGNATVDRILSLPCPTATVYPPDMLNWTWHYTNGIWDPQGMPINPNVTNYIALKHPTILNPNDNNQPYYADWTLALIDNSPRVDYPYWPIMYTHAALLVQRDFTAGGFLASNQGAIYLGHGLTWQLDEPKIILRDGDKPVLGVNDIIYLPGDPSNPKDGQLYICNSTQNPSRQLYHLYQYTAGSQNWNDLGNISQYQDKYYDTLKVVKNVYENGQWVEHPANMEAILRFRSLNDWLQFAPPGYNEVHWECKPDFSKAFQIWNATSAHEIFSVTMDGYISGNIRPTSNYHSADGSPGYSNTVSIANISSITIKNGIITGVA